MLFKGIKYACATCIKGHRSSNCNHVDRPLFEIRKKGRPISQCTVCRDLRKTKQVHAKCSCTHKSNKEQMPVWLHQMEEQDKDASCSCSDASHEHHGAKVGPPTVMTPPSSYSWAVITQPPESNLFPEPNDDQGNLGLIFHKSSTQRFLDGQPRPPRKKSTTKTKRPASPHPSAVQHHALAPSTSSSNTTSSSSSSASPTVATNGFIAVEKHADDTLMSILDLPSSTALAVAPPTEEADLSAILDNVFRPIDQEFKLEDADFKMDGVEMASPASLYGPSAAAAALDAMIIDGTSSPSFDQQQQAPLAIDTAQVNAMLLSNNTSSPLYAASSSMAPAQQPQQPQQPQQQQQQQQQQSGCCGTMLESSASMCQNGQVGMGESVIITIAPLSATTHHPLQDQLRTRIVTCYCGNTCTCPGCLVHPGDFRVGDQFMDPFAGFPASSSSACPSSTASSIYSASDDEEIEAMAPQHALY